MKKIHIRIPTGIKRTLYVTAAMIVSTASVFSGLIQPASALQVTSRYIKMGSSAPSATNVAYKVSFNTATTGNIQGIVIDFCAVDPIIGDSCATANSGETPAGFATNRATTSVNNMSLSGTWTVYSADANAEAGHRIIVTNSSGGSVSSGTSVNFELGNGTSNGFTNPSSTGTFYARMYTYATAAAAQGHDTNTPSGYVDYGGDALSTAAVINITAKVMEQLTFCVYKTTCGDDPSFTLGHVFGGGSTVIIDATAVDTQDTNYSISTNANGGVTVRMKGDTLKSGANDIDPAGATAVAFTAGTEKFGMRLQTAGTGITGDAPYAGPTNYGLDVTSAAGDTTANITSTYGGLTAHTTGPVNNSVTTIRFGATASNTTPAGTYTATEQLIATGTF